MLNQKQIAAARASLGITPQQPAAVDRTTALQQAWGTAPATQTTAPAADPTQPNPVEETGSNYMSDVAPAAQDVNDLAKDFSGGAVDDGAQEGNFGKGVDEMSKGGIANVAGGVEKAGLGVASDAAQAIFAPIAAPIQMLLSHVGKANATGNDPDPAAAEVNSPEAQAARASISSWAAAHPDLAKTLGDAFNVGTAALGSGALDTSVSDAANAVTKPITDAAKSMDINIDTPMTPPDAAPPGAPTATPPDLEKISDMISPKPTIAQAKQAMTEGRLFNGSDPTLLKAGSGPQIAASTQQAASAQTIGRLIPGADSMDEPTLYGALKDKISETAQTLKPQMEATPIKPETVSAVKDNWASLKKTQIEDALATDEPNVTKMQSNFQKFLNKSASGNMNDLWETAKGYDDSIKANVKAATDSSPHELQMAKDIWLQNRGILRDAINDTANGMGKTSQTAFKDMRDMYEGQNGLLSKAKATGEGAPSKLEQFGKTKTGKALKYGAEAVVGGTILDKGLKATTGIGF